ncbi:PEST proteolytic signal-containing nuclear protein [Armadillidium nasatum]|uniref:PEST proteolytic signal-containing nuclear protein n=1 Tax=Armadillidium nasatum TaxID=96803 RepID=A0A5N5SSN9_9CRUS|nr:PEST proteolytic signal-containing nuclear protein [Armadillidium nasatum]
MPLKINNHFSRRGHIECKLKFTLVPIRLYISLSHHRQCLTSSEFGSKLNPPLKRPVEDDEDSSSDNDSNDKKKIAFGIKRDDNEASLKKKIAASSISIKLGAPASKPTSSAPALKPKIGTAALAFNDEDEDEEEEMPPEAKMRMKNIGRDTPTSSGPNSFGKSRMGFCDSKKMYERKLREIQDQLEDK